MRRKWVAVLTVLAAILIISTALFIFRGFIFTKLIEKTVLKAGTPLRFGGYTVFIDKVAGNRLSGITVTEKNRKLQAKSGEYVYIPKEELIKFKLIDGVAEDVSSENPKMFNRLTFKEYRMTVKLKSVLPKAAAGTPE